jgi:hypothetical protein
MSSLLDERKSILEAFDSMPHRSPEPPAYDVTQV